MTGTTHDLTGKDFNGVLEYAEQNGLTVEELIEFMTTEQLDEYLLTFNNPQQPSDVPETTTEITTEITTIEPADDNADIVAQALADNQFMGDMAGAPGTDPYAEAGTDQTATTNEEKYADKVRDAPFISLSTDLDGDGVPDKTMSDDGGKINNYWAEISTIMADAPKDYTTILDTIMAEAGKAPWSDETHNTQQGNMAWTKAWALNLGSSGNQGINGSGSSSDVAKMGVNVNQSDINEVYEGAGNNINSGSNSGDNTGSATADFTSEGAQSQSISITTPEGVTSGTSSTANASAGNALAISEFLNMSFSGSVSWFTQRFSNPDYLQTENSNSQTTTTTGGLQTDGTQTTPNN